jgi:Ser/Thr protein kinase RdoA (MazF antagonist)
VKRIDGAVADTLDRPHDPLEAQVPSFGRDEAEAIAASNFGIRGRASALVSERDQNFRIDVDDGPGWVLKISNAAEDPGVVDMQAEAMLHIARTDPELPVMRVEPTLDGSLRATIEDREGRSHIVRVVTLMPGRNMEAEELTQDAVRALGATAARLGRALRGFFHPTASQPLLWNLKYAMRLRELVGFLEDPARRAILERALDHYGERVEPVFERLRAQVIHNDLTLDNALFADVEQISGILDFGDMGHSATCATWSRRPSRSSANDRTIATRSPRWCPGFTR